MEPFDIKEGERILFKTRNSSYAYKTTDFVDDYVYCTNEVAYYLRDKKIRLVGVDYITLDKPDEGFYFIFTFKHGRMPP